MSGRHPDRPDVPAWDDRLRYVFGLERPAPGTVAVLLAVPEVGRAGSRSRAGGAGARARRLRRRFIVTGALPTDVLEPLHHSGYVVGAFHPLIAVTNPLTARRDLGNAWFSVTGSPEAVSVARVLATAIGSRLISVPAARRPSYHAAAVLTSTMILPLLARSVEMMQRAGVDGDDALAALLPLVQSTLNSIEEGGVPDAIRGPIARGDVETVALHLRALDEAGARLYATLGAETLALARASLDPEICEALDDLFSRYLHLETTAMVF